MKRFYLLVCLFCLLPVSMAFSSTITVKVIDAEGQPLEGVVIENALSSPAGTAAKSLAVVDQIDKAFVPEMIVIQRGQLVDFPNSDNIRHHVYSFSTPKIFELKLYADRPENPVRFDQPGVVVLGCNIHDAMVGYIYIASDDNVVQTDKEGFATLSLNNEAKALTLWHPYQSQGPDHRVTLALEHLEMSAASGVATVTLEIEAPAPRDTFEDTFNAHLH